VDHSSKVFWALEIAIIAVKKGDNDSIVLNWKLGARVQVIQCRHIRLDQKTDKRVTVKNAHQKHVINGVFIRPPLIPKPFHDIVASLRANLHAFMKSTKEHPIASNKQHPTSLAQ
jgi:glutamine amidotransferase PdxT